MVRTRRVIAYIDGYNLYYGLRAAAEKRFLWLDVPALLTGFLRKDQELLRVNFFTSRISAPPASVRRQSQYIDALRSRGVAIIEGRHGGEPETCVCGRRYATHSEKMTDVNIALAVVRDAYLDQFDTAFLVTGDSDQVPTVQLLREVFPDKRVVVLFPPQRVSRHLRQVSHVALNVNENHLRGAQLPDIMMLPNGVTLTRPPEWR